ncbi:unnamed protein product [Nippostrongylus brasiliensis]|uniref:Uncharacterized protein n=1 Tax=Nippostrongylus brasiliensis TaxID=27835 RepID=A0A0N4YH51_NIPBR|nr:unnamed protein product [Nippostrongylus brasiliensis]
MLIRLRLRPVVCSLRRFATVKSDKSPPPKFSESAAFQGRRRGAGVVPSPYNIDYYSTDKFSNRKLISAIGSLAVLVLYFGFLREPSDLDEIWSAPPHILTAGLERKILRDQIKEAEAKGKDTTLLKAQLEYVDVKEEALRIQFQADKKK